MDELEKLKNDCKNICLSLSESTCCFSGSRSQKLPWGYNEKDERCLLVKDRVTQEIEFAISTGYTIFITGMALGFDMMCAEIVLQLREKYPFIKLYCAVPCKGQEKSWPWSQQNRYHNILSKADKVDVLYEKYCRESMLNRNKYMVNNSSKLIALYGGTGGGTKFTIDYARSQGLDITIIKP